MIIIHAKCTHSHQVPLCFQYDERKSHTAYDIQAFVKQKIANHNANCKDEQSLLYPVTGWELEVFKSYPNEKGTFYSSYYTAI